MLMLGDFDLNSMQGYTDSLKDIFKQTMLNQEIVFRKQVQGYLCVTVHVSWLRFSVQNWHIDCLGYDVYRQFSFDGSSLWPSLVWKVLA